jgi:hypothetical protein
MIKSRKPSLPLWVKGAFFVVEVVAVIFAIGH